MASDIGREPITANLLWNTYPVLSHFAYFSLLVMYRKYARAWALRVSAHSLRLFIDKKGVPHESIEDKTSDFREVYYEKFIYNRQ